MPFTAHDAVTQLQHLQPRRDYGPLLHTIPDFSLQKSQLRPQTQDRAPTPLAIRVEKYDHHNLAPSKGCSALRRTRRSGTAATPAATPRPWSRPLPSTPLLTSSSEVRTAFDERRILRPQPRQHPRALHCSLRQFSVPTTTTRSGSVVGQYILLRP